MASKLLRDEFISKIANALNRAASASNLEHHVLEGRVREIFAEELLKPILYPGVEIGTGKIVDSVGTLSAETDLVIYSRNTLPPYVYGHDIGVYPIESCIYAIEVKSTLTAQEINYSQLGREIGLTPQTAKRWLNLLVQTFEWFEIPAFSNNNVKKVSSKPKGYFADTGQVCFSQMISTKETIGGHPLWGALFENAVVSEIRKQCLLMTTSPRMYHWKIHNTLSDQTLPN